MGEFPEALGTCTRKETVNQECMNRSGIEDAHAVVGCTNSTWLVSVLGMEKERVRMDCSPVAWWVKTEKSAANSSFAFETGMANPSMSPAGEIGEAVKPLDARNWFTAAVVSAEGTTNASTYKIGLSYVFYL